MTFHAAGEPRGYPARACSRAIRIEHADVDALYQAGGEFLGTAELRGHWWVRNPVELLRRAERKLARRGVTHFAYQTESTDVWNVSRPGVVNTRCNGSYGCTSVYRPPTTTQRRRGVVHVLRWRVHPEYWGQLPPHLRPS
jgi:hypothetical protein